MGDQEGVIGKVLHNFPPMSPLVGPSQIYQYIAPQARGLVKGKVIYPCFSFHYPDGPLSYTWGESFKYEASPSCVRRILLVNEVIHTSSKGNLQTLVEGKACEVLNELNDNLVLGCQIGFNL